MIRVGTAGWHYLDWNGIVYPRPRPARFDPLQQLARLFDTVEVNATFYRIPAPSMVASWVKRAQVNERFRFTLKLPRTFTHEITGALDDEERLFRACVAPLLAVRKLGAVLVQFPQSFHATAETTVRLRSLLERFSDLPLVVEFRHAGWGTDAVLDLLRRHGAGFCNIDQPRLGSTLRPTSFLTGPVGYVRLHGRNAAAWFPRTRRDGALGESGRSQEHPGRDRSGEPSGRDRSGEPSGRDHAGARAAQRRAERGTAARDRRYDYLYSPRELAPWIGRIRRIAEEGADTYVITNNHFRGKAAVNALEIRAALEGGPVDVPDPLLAAYPHLSAIARPPTDRLPF